MTQSSKHNSSNPTVLLNKIRHNFPKLNWSNYQYVDEGWDHEVIILDNQIVFRFPNDPDYLEQLTVEIAVLEKLAPLVDSVTIPKYSYISEDKKFAGYNYISGTTLTKDIFDRLSRKEVNEIARKIASFLTLLHTCISKGYNFQEVPLSDLLETRSEDRIQVEKYLKPSLSHRDFQLVEMILTDVEGLVLNNLPAVLLHGDIYSTHLLWDAGQMNLGIIDFSDMNIGDPAYDFAELYEYGEEFVRLVYQYYEAPKDDTFLNRAIIYQKWVGVFMMIDFFISHKTTFAKASETFERSKLL
ncbi:MAG: aminoglycoside phosphotransferase family protein [Candidatus Saccharimonadia bacterium]